MASAPAASGHRARIGRWAILAVVLAVAAAGAGAWALSGLRGAPGPALSISYTPTAPLAGGSIAFTATYHGTTAPTSYAWAFGDGTTGEGAAVAHAYAGAGAYEVTVDGTGASSDPVSASVSVTVGAGVPSPYLTGAFSAAPAAPAIAQAVSFSATASGGTSPYRFAWAFGDGSTGVGIEASHAYAAAGTYTVNLTVADSASHSADASQPITVSGGATSTHTFDYLVTILMENHAICDILTSCGGSAPYMTGLAQQYGLATGYVDCSSPSLPNYLCLTGGSDFGCSGYDGSPNSNTCTATAWSSQNIVDRLEAGGLTWKAYMEDMPSNCYGSSSGNYAVKHDPFVYYSDIVNNPTRCALVVPAGAGDSALLNDLGSTSTASNFMWLTPNECNDMHSCSVSVGDAYLGALVPQILGSTVFKTQRAALFITFDEDSGGKGAPDVYTVWAGGVARTAFNSSASYDHFSYLATIEANWHLSPLTSNDAGATAMAEFFASGAAVAASPPGTSGAPGLSALIASADVLASPAPTASSDAAAASPR